MNKYMIYLNSRRCIGCHGCEVHCKTNKGLPVGPYLCEIDHKELTTIKGVPKRNFPFAHVTTAMSPFAYQSVRLMP